MQREATNHWESTGRTLVAAAALLGLAGMGAGCPEPLKAPTAVVSFADDDGGGGGTAGGGADAGMGDIDAGAAGSGASGCLQVAAPIAGRVGEPPAITGACSFDPQGLALSYSWALVDQPGASRAAISNPASVTPTFVPDVPGVYRLRLVVSNGRLTSDPAEVIVEVGDCGLRAPVVAASADPAAPNVGQAVRLEPTVSDADTADDCGAHAAEFEYRWELLEAPAGSAAALSDAGARTPSLTPDVPGTYRARLTVTDPTGRSGRAEVEVTASECGSAAPSVDDIAVAPTDAPAVGQAVRLEPTVSDADTADDCGAHAAEFEYRWELLEAPAGSAAALSDAGARTPSLTPDVPGTYRARLTVTDPTGRSGRAEVEWTAGTCGTNAPTVVAVATPTSANPGQGISLQATVSDADNDAPCSLGQRTSVRWRLAGVPAGSRAVVTAPSAERASFVPDVPGDYEVEVVATDDTGLVSEPARVTVSVSSCGLAAPVARLEAYDVRDGRWLVCDPGDTVDIDLANRAREVDLRAAGSFDPDNRPPCSLEQTLRYRWTLVDFPPGRDVAGGTDLRYSDTYQTALRIDRDVPGDYTVQLEVTDETGLTSRPSVCTLRVRNPRN